MWVFYLMSTNLLFSVLILVEPIFFKEIIDTLIGFDKNIEKYPFSSIVNTLVLWLVVVFFTILTRLFVSTYSDILCHQKFDDNISKFFNKILDLHLRFHFDSNSGQLVKKITKWVDWLFDIQLNFLRRMVPSVLTIILLIPIVLYFNLKLWLFVIIVWIFSFFITFFLSAKTFSKQRNVEFIYSNLSAFYGDTFSNMPIVKSFCLKNYKNIDLKKLMQKRYSIQYPILKWWGLIVSLSKIINIIVSIGIISFGSYLFINWEITIWTIVMFLSFSALFLSAIDDLTWTLETIFWRLAGVKDYFEILDTKIEVNDKKWSINLKKVKWSVEFKNLYFSYDSKRDVLKNINILINPWEKIAFVGHTWSGKTTMVNMLLKFFEPQKWSVFIDNIDIRDITQDSLRDNIWVVFQDNSLFNTSILNNIKLWNKKATREDIEIVSKKSNSSSFIDNLSQWLDTIVWERWVKLSGWEKQRLAIARAFLKNAPILVLDEATSSLDAETEKYLQDSFDELMKWRTTFIVAHRLSTIKKADKIFLFNKWEIIESWNYKELMTKKWKFSKLVEAQVEGFID